MKIAVIGSGIAGNVAAYHLSREHEITVYEANDYIGGHTHTHTIDWHDQPLQIDSGFIVFNYRTYPQFTALLDELGVEVQASDMSFSVRCDRSGLEYNGTNLNTLFAQRRNLVSPVFYRMIRDILRFNREAPQLLEQPHEMSLGDYLSHHQYSGIFIDNYIVPMGAAIWSTDPRQILEFPARFFVSFFHNHGMLSVNDRPTWFVIKGGSRQYVDKLIQPYRERIRLNCPVKSIRRFSDRVEIMSDDHGIERYDAVFIASHSDQALQMLTDASAVEREVLGAIPYQRNEAVLHTDTGLLPKRRLAWAAWNYHRLQQHNGHVALTYNMNILQGLQTDTTFCVTLNNSERIDPSHVIKRMYYDHPVFTQQGIAAQARHAELNGVNRTWFCGAYWRNGFHEDGVVSALAALEHFRERQHEQLHLRRAG